MNNIFQEQIFYKKYLLYKKKYLELKKQLGGVVKVAIQKKSPQTTIIISGLLAGTKLAHLQNYLINKIKNQIIPNGSEHKGSFFINFKDSVDENIRASVENLLNVYDPTIPIKRISKFIQPWKENSFQFYIALPIVKNTNIGMVINNSSTISHMIGTSMVPPVTQASPYIIKEIDDGLKMPHVSLLEILIPEDGMVQRFLTKEGRNFNDFIIKIKEIFENIFLNKQFHSKRGNYKEIIGLYVRAYDDNQDYKAKYITFVKKVAEELIYAAANSSAVKIDIKNDEEPYSSPKLYNGKCNYFSIKDNVDPGLAVTSFYYNDWIPHISLVKKKTELPGTPKEEHMTKEKFKNDFEKETTYNENAMSKINLWKFENGGDGSLTSVYGSYSINKIPKNNSQHFCCYQDF